MDVSIKNYSYCINIKIELFINNKLIMSLVSHINRICPKGVSHTHGPNVLNNSPNNTSCCLCTDNLVRKQFHKTCKNFQNEVTYSLSKEKLLTLNIIFSREEFWLPQELRDIIFKKSVYTILVPIPIKFDKIGIDHMLNCRLCSRDFMIFLNKHSCNNHIIPRINYGDENDINFLMNI